MRDMLVERKDFDILINKMVERRLISLEGDLVRIIKAGEFTLSFLASLIWPFVDAYYMVATF
jgi:hypothetical protein